MIIKNPNMYGNPPIDMIGWRKKFQNDFPSANLLVGNGPYPSTFPGWTTNRWTNPSGKWSTAGFVPSAIVSWLLAI